MTPRQQLIADAAACTWFHAIDFGDYVSPSRSRTKGVPNGSLQPVWEFLQHLNVAGLDCLDIGAADGIVAFTLKQMGARRVVATDVIPRRPFLIARELLALDVEYITDLPDTELGRRFAPENFDLIVMAGFLYHLFSPLNAIAACRRILRPGGLLITESCYTGGAAPAAYLSTEMEPPLTQEPSTYWIFTPSAIEGMLKLSCFDVLGSASVGGLRTSGGIGRVGHIARAVAPDEVGNRRPQLVSTHTKVSVGPPLNFQEMRSRGTTRPIPYAGPQEHVVVGADRYPEWVPLLPTRERCVTLATH
jgi:SAM-dependent methyltransferase